MKHSNDTRGFSSDSIADEGHLPSMLEFSIFRPPLSAVPVLTLAGDWFVCVLLFDGLWPRMDLVATQSVRVAGDLDRRPEISPESRRRGWLPVPPLPIWTTLTDPIFLLAGDCSGLLAGDFPAVISLRQPNSPEKERALLTFAGDLLTLWRASSSANVETLSLTLQTSETSEISSGLMKSFSFSFSTSVSVGFSASNLGFHLGVSDNTSFTVSSSGGGALFSEPFAADLGVSKGLLEGEEWDLLVLTQQPILELWSRVVVGC